MPFGRHDSTTALHIRETQTALLKEARLYSAEILTSKQPIPLLNLLSDMDNHSGMCLPYRHSVDELKQQLIQVWYSLDQDIIDCVDQSCL